MIANLPLRRKRTTIAHPLASRERVVNREPNGQSIVELAIVVPILLLILLGAIDLGRAFYAYVSISNAARVGAEFAMEPRRTQSEVRTIIKAETAPRITLQDSDISLTTPGWVAGNDLTVTVSTLFTAATPMIDSLWGGGPLTMTTRSTTRFN